MTDQAFDVMDLLRRHDLRRTPQRRAILGAFEGGPLEHLSSEEVHACATEALPELSRGTVYATLAEFAEMGLIGAVGVPEPVRYETNVVPHDHFRCRVCLRLFDLDRGRRHPDSFILAGFRVERVEVRAEGVCEDCADYGAGLAAGAEAIVAASPTAEALERSGVAAVEIDSPVGPLLLGAGPGGLFRVAFAEHADADRLREFTARRRGVAATRDHLERAAEGIGSYFAARGAPVEATVDWDALPPDWVDSLRATRQVPFAARRSFLSLIGETPPRVAGEAFGANPVLIVVPCHRVMRGAEVPDVFVGGGDRRRLLLAQEREGPVEAGIGVNPRREADLWMLVDAGDPVGRRELVLLYMPLARRMARRYAGVAEPYDDLLQVASLGLLKAIDRYDPARGIPFAGFAKPTIHGELRRHFRDKVWTVRVPRSLHDLMARTGKAEEDLRLELRRPPTVEEIARHLGTAREEILEALAAGENRRTLSLDAPPRAGEGEDGRSAELVGEEDGGYGLIEDRMAVEAALPGLDQRERAVLRMRFTDELPQTRIAERLGCSQMHISRLLRRALDRLRDESEDPPAVVDVG